MGSIIQAKVNQEEEYARVRLEEIREMESNVNQEFDRQKAETEAEVNSAKAQLNFKLLATEWKEGNEYFQIQE